MENAPPSIHPLTPLQERYTLQAKLGEGGFGTIHEATQITTGQRVAVKFLRLRPDDANTSVEKQAARFRRETSLCAKLYHPHIVRLIDAGLSAENQLYSVFEFVPGKNLAQVLKEEGPLAPREVHRLMSQVLDALGCAHKENVVHRDLKPQNIMVTGTGVRRNAVVLDFGLGTLVEDSLSAQDTRLTGTMEWMGTPSYAAPEQLRKDATTAAADLYAWGLIFIECLTGVRIMQGATMAEVLYKQLGPEPVPLPPSLRNHPLGQLLRRVTEKNSPEQRGTAAELLSQLEEMDLSGLLSAPALPEAVLLPSTTPRTGEGQALTPTAVGSALTLTTNVPPQWMLAGGERRQVVALCCGLVLSHPDPARVDFEDLELPLRASQELLGAIAARYHGHIMSVLGQQVLMYFGYPSTRVDDARRAAAAAMAILEGIDTLNSQRKEPLRCSARIGLHVGQLVVSKEAAAQPWREFGVTASVAAQLGERAEPGTILVGESAYPLLRDHFTLESQGQVPTGFLQQPMELFSLKGPRVATDEAPSMRGSIVMVSRDHELGLLLERWRQVDEGSGQVALVRGEAGIGKSRLCHELRRKLQGREHQFFECRCSPEARNSPLFPVIEPLKQLLGYNEGDSPAQRLARMEEALSRYPLELKEAVPLVASLFALPVEDRYPTPQMTPLKLKELTLRLLVTLFYEMAEQCPLLLFVEDLHWADPTLLELLGALLAECATSPVYLLLTSRPEFSTPWPNAPILQIQLGRLEREATEQLIRALTEANPLPPSMLEQIVQRTEGVPLFVEELTRMVAETRPSSPQSGLAIPSTLRGSLLTRLDLLGSPKVTAQIASALGREFQYDVLCAISPRDEAELKEDLEQLLRADLIYTRRRARSRTYIFKHALIQDIAYDSLPKATRRHLHARIAETLQARFPELAETRPELLAHHFAAADQLLQALEYGRKAAVMALQRSANEESAQHTTQALGWLQTVENPSERRETELGLNGLLLTALMGYRGFSSEEVGNVLRRSMALLEEQGDSPSAFPTLHSLWGYHEMLGEHAQAKEIGRRCLELARRNKDEGQQICALIQLGHGLWFDGRFEEAQVHFEEVLALYEPSKHGGNAYIYAVDSRAHATGMLALTHWYLGFTDLALKRAREALEFARLIQHSNTLAMATYYLTLLHQLRGEREEVLRLSTELLEISVAQGLPMWKGLALLLNSWAKRQATEAEQILAVMESVRVYQTLPYQLGRVAETEAEVGAVDKALQRVERALQLATSKEELYALPELYRLRGELLLRSTPSATEEAAVSYQKAIEMAQEQRARVVEFRARLALARLKPEQLREPGFRAALAGLQDTLTPLGQVPEREETGRLLAQA
ncbi:TOMM system kinase/cyclase fusion protein [Hyalangium minutum]|uniref:Serine/threonine protein kinase n=1 Tax=Hyalangium minutum TaxID=394096 RepID=A0A085VYT4_9BACT|nr:TOMM system kinase/cyclase fusion protein [Hyalangium minutum]KFE60597.1 Serine/threonine protein kinase [Hyalangium minutum]